MTHHPIDGIDDRELAVPPYPITPDPDVARQLLERDAFRLAAGQIASEHKRTGQLVSRARMRWIGRTCAEFVGIPEADIAGVVAELAARTDVAVHVEAEA